MRTRNIIWGMSAALAVAALAGAGHEPMAAPPRRDPDPEQPPSVGRCKGRGGKKLAVGKYKGSKAAKKASRRRQP